MDHPTTAEGELDVLVVGVRPDRAHSRGPAAEVFLHHYESIG
jgi:hypothetical protein